jgi:hypothetical protein
VSEVSLTKCRLLKSENSNRNSWTISAPTIQHYCRELRGIPIIDWRSTGELKKADDDELKSILDTFIPESGLAMKQ